MGRGNGTTCLLLPFGRRAATSLQRGKSIETQGHSRKRQIVQSGSTGYILAAIEMFNLHSSPDVGFFRLFQTGNVKSA